ncbi:hypothetical protein Tco_0650046 [Tanacetum coccineum]
MLSPTKNDWDMLFQPMLDEHFNPSPSVVSLVLAITAQRPTDLTGVEESLKTPHFHDDPIHEDSTSQGPSSNVQPSYTLLDLLVSTRKQLNIDAMWCYFDVFLTSVELKNFKEAMLESSCIEAMQEEIHEFEGLQVWELVHCPDFVMLIKLKWIYKVKKDELEGVLKTRLD